MNPSVTSAQVTKKQKPFAPENGSKEIYYPETETKVMGETDYHFQQIQMLYEMLRLFFDSRRDVYISSDIFVYYEEGNPRRRFAPDVMVCFGAENKPRRVYKFWEERIVPAVIIEVASNATWEKDMTTKRRLFERLGVAEYYVFDAEYQYLPQPLLAYRLEVGDLVRQAVNNNRIYSPALGLELVDTGKNLRLFDSQRAEFLPTAQELAEAKQAAESENARLKAEIERLTKLNK